MAADTGSQTMKGGDPRLSFSTQEFKDSQRAFSDGIKKNFGRPIEYAYVQQYPWSVPQIMKLAQPVDVHGSPWPLDSAGKPVIRT